MKQTSKFLSYILRHSPESIGLELTPQGWANVDEIIAKSDLPLTHEIIQKVVASSDKQRFSLNPDKTQIRANQGHSFPVDLGLVPVAAPEQLFHGTAKQNLESILSEGLKPQSRQYVHLSQDAETARSVGMRHGKPVILIVDAKLMQSDGIGIYLSENGVWLCDVVPAKYLATL
ncbi:MAG TPA: RNA 2'-phosphotransferase [Aliiroseovarius sp.]|nr:RNA 2'-phosphotransferase [Aliiroseovarius sp.]